MRMLVMFLVLFLGSRDARIIDLDKRVIMDLGLQLERNNVVFVHPVDIDVEQGSLFILDLRLGHILKVDLKNGHLEKIISSKGQGPGELSWPMCMRVKEHKIYVGDKSYGGIKIFNADSGDLINAIKINAEMDDIDVDNNGSLILKKVQVGSGAIIEKMDPNGKPLRECVRLITSGSKTQIGDEYFKKTFIKFRMDSKENLVVLFLLDRMIRKYDKKGILTWEKRIDNKVLSENAIMDDSVRMEGDAVSFTYNIFNLAVDVEDNILVGHNGGGVLYSPHGNEMALVKGFNLQNFSMIDGTLVSVLPQGYAHIYDFSIKEDVD